MELNIANCCGTCIWANSAHKKKAVIDTHAAHYTVAKTERWCLKHNIPTVREAICHEGYELDNKKGGSPAVKRARSQNIRLEKIIKCKEYVLKNGPIEFDRRIFMVVDDRLLENILIWTLIIEWTVKTQDMMSF